MIVLSIDTLMMHSCKSWHWALSKFMEEYRLPSSMAMRIQWQLDSLTFQQVTLDVGVETPL